MGKQLLTPLSSPKMISLQLTSVCNLRCVYCPQHNGHYKGIFMHQEMIEDLVAHISDDSGISNVSIGFFGETLCSKGWEDHLERLLDAGKRLDICSNFHHVLSDRHVDVLSRFSSIQFSIDSVDIARLKEIRPPADIRQIVHNMHLIRGRAIETGRPIPQMTWSCTLTNRAVPGLTALAAYAVSCCVPCLNFNELVYYDTADHSISSVFDLYGREFMEAYEAIQKVKEILRSYNVQVQFAATDWQKRFEAKRQRAEASLETAQKPASTKHNGGMIQGSGKFSPELGMRPLDKGQTRLCLEPWRNLYLMPSGDVYTCCTRGDSMGVVRSGKDIAAVRNNEAYNDLRRQLLSGEVCDKACRNCSLKPAVPPEALQKAVKELGVKKQEGGHV